MSKVFVDPDLFKQAMARLGASVNLITTDGPTGMHGLTASAVCSVTAEPPTVLVCVNRSSQANARIKENGVVGISILADRHQAMSNMFGDNTVGVEERFAQPDQWTRLGTGAPLLADASAALDCRVSEIAEVGTHTVFFCEVEAILLHEDCETLIYFNRAYHGLR